jgi:hypothetical protein
MNASTLRALRPLLDNLLAMPRVTVEDDLRVDETVAAALLMIADAIDGTDAENTLRDAAADIVATVRDTRERDAVADADEQQRRAA